MNKYRYPLRVYWNYLKYLLMHKYYVFIECIKHGLFVHSITHDLSKFLPSEFFPYARKFYGGDYVFDWFNVESRFSVAWLFHQRRNKHHWDYWVLSSGEAVPMPRKYVSQMICDWQAMGRVYGDNARQFYITKGGNFNLHSSTRERIEDLLDVWGV